MLDGHEQKGAEMFTRRVKAFTLVELLVVIAIISTLMALLLPTLEEAFRSARIVQCANRQRQYGLFMESYANDYNSVLPSAGHDHMEALAIWKSGSAYPLTNENISYSRFYYNLSLYGLTYEMYYCPGKNLIGVWADAYPKWSWDAGDVFIAFYDAFPSAEIPRCPKPAAGPGRWWKYGKTCEIGYTFFANRSQEQPGSGPGGGADSSHCTGPHVWGQTAFNGPRKTTDRPPDDSALSQFYLMADSNYYAKYTSRQYWYMTDLEILPITSHWDTRYGSYNSPSWAKIFGRSFSEFKIPVYPSRGVNRLAFDLSCSWLPSEEFTISMNYGVYDQSYYWGDDDRR